jgi:hypothetical protein
MHNNRKTYKYWFKNLDEGIQSNEATKMNMRYGFVAKAILEGFIRIIDINRKLSIKTLKVDKCIYKSLAKKIGFVFPDKFDWRFCVPDKADDGICICEIDFVRLHEKGFIKDSMNNPSELEYTSEPFVDKNINVVVSDVSYDYNEPFFRIPKFIIQDNYQLLTLVHLSEGKLIEDYTVKNIVFEYRRHMLSTFENTIRLIIGLDTYKIQKLVGKLFLFFTQDNDKITWYCTIFGSPIPKVTIFGRRLAMFSKPINLSEYEGPEKRALDLIMASIIKSGGQTID